MPPSQTRNFRRHDLHPLGHAGHWPIFADDMGANEDHVIDANEPIQRGSAGPPSVFGGARRGRPPQSSMEAEALSRELKAFKDALRDVVERARKLGHALQMIADDARVPQHVRTLARTEKERNCP